MSISGLILAGGQGQRLGGKDKGLVLLKNRPLITHVIERFAPQVGQLAISANRNLSKYERFNLPVLTDASDTFEGPLAGILAGLRWCSDEYLAIAACDSPLLPSDLVSNLFTAMTCDESDIAVASADGKRQPVFAILKSYLAESLAAFLATGDRKIGRWYDSQPISYVEFDDARAFTNINTARDLHRLEERLL